MSKIDESLTAFNTFAKRFYGGKVLENAGSEILFFDFGVLISLSCCSENSDNE